MSNELWIFIGTVFVTVALLSQAMIVPVFSESRKTRKKRIILQGDPPSQAGSDEIDGISD